MITVIWLTNIFQISLQAYVPLFSGSGLVSIVLDASPYWSVERNNLIWEFDKYWLCLLESFWFRSSGCMMTDIYINITNVGPCKQNTLKKKLNNDKQ